MVKSRTIVILSAAGLASGVASRASTPSSVEAMRMCVLLVVESGTRVAAHLQRDAAHAVDAALHDPVTLERHDLDLGGLQPLDRLGRAGVHDDAARFDEQQILRRVTVVLVARHLDD